MGLATHTAFRRSGGGRLVLARDQQQAQNCAYDVAPFSARPAGCALRGASLAFAPCSHSIGPAGRSIGFALLGESLFPNARMAGPSKVTKNACPCTGLGIPGSLRSTSLIPSLLRGSPRKGHPCRRRPRPFTALAASMPLAPLRSDSIRPPERGDPVVSDGPCSEAVVRVSGDRRVGNAKLTHRVSCTRFETNRRVDCGGKCSAVFHPTKPAED